MVRREGRERCPPPLEGSSGSQGCRMGSLGEGAACGVSGVLESLSLPPLSIQGPPALNSSAV